MARNEEHILEDEVKRLTKCIEEKGIAKVILIEEGNMLLKKGDETPREHFGFADGLSQPRYFDYKNEMYEATDAIKKNLNLVFVNDIEDGNVNDKFKRIDAKNINWDDNKDLNFGSYLVYGKLEQNVESFNKKIGDIVNELKIPKDFAEAQVIGRFKDGTPLSFSEKPGIAKDDESVIKFNNSGLIKNKDGKYEVFFKGDEEGQRCPFHAHIRKVNPRKRVISKEKDKNEEIHTDEKRIVRRGIPYGKERSEQLDDAPQTGHGLLFMSYQASIENQFEFILKNWSNNQSFPEENVGIDPILGNGNNNVIQHWNTKWDDLSQQSKKPFDFSDVVKFKGGEYFYTPSLTFLKEIKDEIGKKQLSFLSSSSGYKSKPIYRRRFNGRY